MAGAVGASDFKEFAADMRRIGNGAILREMTKEMRVEAKPLTDEIKDAVTKVDTSSTHGVSGLLAQVRHALRHRERFHTNESARGGASARAERVELLLKRRKKLTEKARLSAHRRSGLRASASRTVQFQVRTGPKSASIRIKSNKGLMPASQRMLPDYMNRGRWGHPTFGHKPNVLQRVNPPEWFDGTAQRDAPGSQRKIIAKLSDYIYNAYNT